jgi:anti-sigma B factor antagonist
MDIQHTHELRIVRIAALGTRLDGRAAKALLAEGNAAIARGPLAIVFDLSDIRMIDSLGIAALVSLANRASGRVRVALCGLCENVEKLVTLTHLHDLFDIYADYRTAERQLSN